MWNSIKQIGKALLVITGFAVYSVLLLLIIAFGMLVILKVIG